MGPFDIAPERIEALRAGFTPFVSKLLNVEARHHGLQRHLLSVNLKENLADGGVDAAVRGAPSSDYLPAGDSAWQFKQGDLRPAACATEFANADWAHEFLRAGGSYVLVLGASLSDKLIENRRKKIADKAIELNLLAADDNLRIRVYDANKLAQWASRFPSLAVSRLAGGPGG